MPDIFDRVEGAVRSSDGAELISPFTLKMVGTRCEITAGGKPVDLRLIQRVVIDINASTLLPSVRFEFVATAVTVELENVEIGATLVPLEKEGTYDFANQKIVAEPPKSGTIDPAWKVKLGDEYAKAFPTKKETPDASDPG